MDFIVNTFTFQSVSLIFADVNVSLVFQYHERFSVQATHNTFHKYVHAYKASCQGTDDTFVHTAVTPHTHSLTQFELLVLPHKLFFIKPAHKSVNKLQLALTMACTSGVVIFHVRYTDLIVVIRLVISVAERFVHHVEYILDESNCA